MIIFVVCCAKPIHHILFCDRDNIWLPDKIRLSLDSMRQAEHTQQTQNPILVHSDASIVDNQLKHFIGSRCNIKGINAIAIAPARKGPSAFSCLRGWPSSNIQHVS